MKKVKAYLNKIKGSYKIKKQLEYYNNVITDTTLQTIKNEKVEKINRVIFVVNGITAFSGGHTSILRLGTQLANNNYQVIYASYIEQDKEEMKNNAKVNLSNYKGEIASLKEVVTSKNDVIIATYWESVYYVSKLQGYKMYFVQDFEPFFYEYGEKFILANKTYECGIDIIALGKWNIAQIEKYSSVNGNSKLRNIDFPYEKSEYKAVKRNFEALKNKKNINICVYVKEDVKRAPYMLQDILVKAKERLINDNITLNITYYGGFQGINLKGGVNKGKLTKAELFNLYKESDFGMVASLTNISLTPYEMIATKLPVIEFAEGSFNYFFEKGSAIIIDLNADMLYEKIKYYHSHPQELYKVIENGYNSIQKLSWEKSAQQFIEILKENVLI